jgi:hypothetical protein
MSRRRSNQTEYSELNEMDVKPDIQSMKTDGSIPAKTIIQSIAYGLLVSGLIVIGVIASIAYSRTDTVPSQSAISMSVISGDDPLTNYASSQDCDDGAAIQLIYTPESCQKYKVGMGKNPTCDFDIKRDACVGGALSVAGDVKINGKLNASNIVGFNTTAIKGDKGDTGAQGPAGVSCWDLNGNGVCNLATEDKNNDTVCNVTDCKGEKGDTGATGAAGSQGSIGPAGSNGLNCWDLNGNGVCNLATEDANNDTVCNVTDCRGPAGEAVHGTNGQHGLDCWDLDGDDICDINTEDMNNDGNCTVLDCRGQDGAEGPAGVACWDLNGNGVCNPTSGSGPTAEAFEDVDGDGSCTVLDCKGATGSSGSNGAAGTNGVHCWDLNQNGACNLGSEDINSDGACNVTDCKGATGAQGPAGSQGPAGATGAQGPAGVATGIFSVYIDVNTDIGDGDISNLVFKFNKTYIANGAYDKTNGLYTIPTTGIYTFTSTVRWFGPSTSGSTLVLCSFYVNGAIVAAPQSSFTLQSNYDYSLMLSTTMSFNAGDTIGVYKLHFMGSSGSGTVRIRSGSNFHGYRIA